MATLCRMTFRPAFFWKHVLPAVLAFGLALALAQTIWIQRVENLLLDVCTQFRTKFQPPADARLVVVGIDDGSIDALGRWPWSRRVHGQFMYSLSFGKPAVMAWGLARETSEALVIAVALGTSGALAMLEAQEASVAQGVSAGNLAVSEPGLLAAPRAESRVPAVARGWAPSVDLGVLAALAD